MNPQRMPVHLFCVSSPEESADEQVLREHLMLYIQQRRICVWLSHEIPAGSERTQELRRHVDKSQIVVFLVSAKLYAQCWALLDYTIQCSKDKYVVPVYLSSTVFDSEMPLGQLIWLPRNNLPIKNWPRSDDAWVEVARGICNLVVQIQEARMRVVSMPSPAGVLYSHDDIKLLRKIRICFIPKEVPLSYLWIAEELSIWYEDEDAIKRVIRAAEALLRESNLGDSQDLHWT